MAKRSQQPRLITGLDIGSTGIRIAVGQFTPGDRFGDLQIISTAEVDAEGIQKGAITSIEEAVSAISYVLEEADRLIGVPIESAWVGVSGTQILSKENRGVVAVAKSDGEISDEDVDRVLDAAQTIAGPLNYEVLHILPKSFFVDGQSGIKDPVGMTGVRLEVDAQMIYGATPHIKNLTKAIYRTGIDIDDLVLSIVATADAVVTDRQKELGVVTIDIGGSTTTMAVFEEGNLVHTAVIPIGSNHVTNDLALGLQTSIDIAERIKLSYGRCIGKGVTKRDKISLADFGVEDADPVSKKFVIEIIAARVIEILDKVNAELDAVERKSLLPAGAVFTGGGAKLHGLVDIAKHVLQMNASYGYPQGIQSATDKINDLSYTTAIGLVRWGAININTRPQNTSFRIPGGKQAGEQVKKLLKFLLP